MEVGGRIAENSTVQRVFGIIGEISDYTPKGILANVGTKVVDRIAPGTLQALGGQIEELKTRVGVAVDVVVTRDDGTVVRRDVDTKPESENYYEVAGGKGVTSVTVAAVLGSVGRKLGIGKSDGPDATPNIETPPHADVPDVPKKFTINEHREHHDLEVSNVANEYRAQGYEISNTRQATFGGACGVAGSCRTDLIGRGPDGKVVVFEVKTGDAQLSIRQSDIYPQIRDGNAIPRGKVAKDLGLTAGLPLKNQNYPNGIQIIEVRKPGLGK